MRIALTKVGLLLAFIFAVASGASATPTGPVYPPPGGVTLGTTGTNVADVGGKTYTFTGLNTSAYDILYWGLAVPPTASLDGSPDGLTFTSQSSNVMVFDGVTSWLDADPPGGNFVAANIRMVITLGAGAAWVDAASLGLSPTLGRVAQITGTSFSANVSFFANTGSGYQALNTVHQFVSQEGKTTSNFGGGFYYTAPDAGSTLTLLSLALGGLAAARRRLSSRG